jgi:hypothetical protein
MRILLIGNFAPPYEEENLHNLSLLNKLKEEGNDCYVINISENPSKEERFINTKNYFDFVLKLIRYGWRKDVIHFLTKGYTRPGLMKLMTTIVFGKILFAKTIITLHSELFSIFGQLRSKLGGQQLLHLSFSLANKVICADKHTYEVASLHYKLKEKFAIIPSFIHIPEDIKENERFSLKKLQNKKKVIVFSNVRYPSLLFEILNHLLSNYLDPEIGIAISFSEIFSTKLRHVIEDTGKKLADNMVFVESTDRRMLSFVYAKSDLVLRTLSCDGKPLFDNIALCIKRSVHSENYSYFPVSLSLIKEGDVSDSCAYIFNKLLLEKTESLYLPTPEDSYLRIKEIYSK